RPDHMPALPMSAPCLSVLAVALAVVSAHAWQTDISGNVVGGFDEAHDVAFGKGGDVYGAGYSEDFAFGPRFTVANLARDGGRVLWKHDLGPTEQGLQRLVIDRNGDVIAG